MDKIDRLLDAMEHPDRYTSAELDAMLNDAETKEVFELLNKTKSSLQTISTPNIDAEWKKFEEEHGMPEKYKFIRLTRLFSRNAAASIAIALASFTAVAAIVGVGIHYVNTNRAVQTPETEIVVKNKTLTVMADTIQSVEIDKEKPVEIVAFDDEPLEIILNRIAEYYDYKVTFNNENSKSLRLYFKWNQAHTIEEVVERLNNFEQINLTVNDKTIKAD